MKSNRRRIILAMLGLVVLVGGVWSYLIYSSGERAVARYKRKLIASGEKLRVEDWWPKPVELDLNGNAIFVKAQALGLNRQNLLSTNSPVGMRLVQPGKAIIGWAQPDVRDSRTNSWEQIEAALGQQAPAFEVLEQIIERPFLDFQLDYSQGYDLVLPHLAQIKSTAQRLAAGAICDLHRHDPEAAIRKARTILALVKGMEREPLIISQLVRISIAQIAVTASWELLQSENLTDAQLLPLQEAWFEVQFLPGAQQALGMEGAMNEETIARMRNSSAEFRRVANGWTMTRGGGGGASWWQQVGEGAVMKTRESIWRVAWSHTDELRSLRGHHAIVEAARLARSQGAFKPALDQQQNKLIALGITNKSQSDSALFDLSEMDDLSSLFTKSVFSLQRFLHRTMIAEVARQLTVTAIALKRYQLQHTTESPELAALVPEFLPAIPRDPVDGRNLRYRSETNGGFTLYSIGADGEDNGGDPSRPVADQASGQHSRTFPWQYGKDFVWPKVASPEESEAFYTNEIARGR